MKSRQFILLCLPKHTWSASSSPYVIMETLCTDVISKTLHFDFYSIINRLSLHIRQELYWLTFIGWTLLWSEVSLFENMLQCHSCILQNVSNILIGSGAPLRILGPLDSIFTRALLPSEGGLWLGILRDIPLGRNHVSPSGAPPIVGPLESS